MGDRGWCLGASLVITLRVAEDSIGRWCKITRMKKRRVKNNGEKKIQRKEEKKRVESIGGIYNDVEEDTASSIR